MVQEHVQLTAKVPIEAQPAYQWLLTRATTKSKAAARRAGAVASNAWHSPIATAVRIFVTFAAFVFVLHGWREYTTRYSDLSLQQARGIRAQEVMKDICSPDGDVSTTYYAKCEQSAHHAEMTVWMVAAEDTGRHLIDDAMLISAIVSWIGHEHFRHFMVNLMQGIAPYMGFLLLILAVCLLLHLVSACRKIDKMRDAPKTDLNHSPTQNGFAHRTHHITPTEAFGYDDDHLRHRQNTSRV